LWRSDEDVEEKRAAVRAKHGRGCGGGEREEARGAEMARRVVRAESEAKCGAQHRVARMVRRLCARMRRDVACSRAPSRRD